METVTTVTIDGKTVLVDEVALALARATQFGSSAAVSVEATVTGAGNGYSVTPVVTSKVGAR